jgi:hypothetical protein
MIFQNRPIGKEITIDIDSFFWYFVRPKEEEPEGEKPPITLYAIRERLERMVKIKGIPPVMAYYRRSSNDHAHVKLAFKEKITVLDAFMIRAWMFDDQTRLSLDLSRYLMTDSLHEMNRCFDEKATMDGVKQAGPWIPLKVGRDEYELWEDGLKDWQAYLIRWNAANPAEPKQTGLDLS